MQQGEHMTQATLVADGLYFGEGPRWRDGRLWFSDFYDHAVRSLDESGRLRTELQLDDQPSGLGWLPDGRLLVVAMKSRRVMRADPDGLKLHADLSQIATGKANDMVVDARGRAYVGNFGFDLDAALAERGVEGVLADHPTADVACVEADGKVRVAAPGLHFPNGMVITRDGRTLIVAETLALRLAAFDVAPDGSLSNQRVWAAVGMRAPDGICLDAAGNVWIANAIAPECVLFAPGGKVLAVVETDQPCFACALGGADGHTLYALTAPSSVAAVASSARQGCVLAARVETPAPARL
jgi:sugar lactone lactonase YvrE